MASQGARYVDGYSKWCAENGVPTGLDVDIGASGKQGTEFNPCARLARLPDVYLTVSVLGPSNVLGVTLAPIPGTGGKCTVDRMTWGDRSRDVFVDFFFGGEARVKELTAFFTELKKSGATLCVLTKGETPAVGLPISVAALRVRPRVRVRACCQGGPAWHRKSWSCQKGIGLDRPDPLAALQRGLHTATGACLIKHGPWRSCRGPLSRVAAT